MTDKNLDKKIMELKELKLMRSELDEEITKLENELKEEMKLRKTYVLSVGIHKLTYKSIASKRFDSKALKASDEGLYNRFVKVSQSMRFTVS